MAALDHLNIDVLFGAPSIGLLVASFMSGVVTLQAFFYYRTYPKDSIPLKALVAFIWLLDLAHLIAITHFVYYHTITHWGDVSVLGRLTWSWAFELLLNSLIMFTCQIFLTYRFKIISDGNWWITSVLIFFAVVQLVIGIFSGVTAIWFSNKEFTASTATDIRSKAIGSTWLVSGALDDVLIALSLSYYLHTRSGMHSTLVDRLIIYIGSTGALTSVISIANIVAYVAMPNSFIDLAFNFPLGRIYTNSLLSSLNMRQTLRDSDNMPSLSLPSFILRTSAVITTNPGGDEERAPKD